MTVKSILMRRPLLGICFYFKKLIYFVDFFRRYFSGLLRNGCSQYAYRATLLQKSREITQYSLKKLHLVFDNLWLLSGGLAALCKFSKVYSHPSGKNSWSVLLFAEGCQYPLWILWWTDNSFAIPLTNLTNFYNTMKPILIR